jgi:hypothetical protein
MERRNTDKLHGPEKSSRQGIVSVFPSSDLWRARPQTHEEKLDPTVHATTRRKYQVPMSPAGKRAMSNIETAAQPNRVHMAMSHCIYDHYQSQPPRARDTDEALVRERRVHFFGRGTESRLTGLSGLSPLLHLAAR